LVNRVHLGNAGKGIPPTMKVIDTFRKGGQAGWLPNLSVWQPQVINAD